jgi:hypothetical protein
MSNIDRSWSCGKPRQNPVICAAMTYLIRVMQTRGEEDFRTLQDIITNLPEYTPEQVTAAVRQAARQGLFQVESCNALNTNVVVQNNEFGCPGQNPDPDVAAQLTGLNPATGIIRQAPQIGAALRYAFNPEGVYRNPRNVAYLAPNVPLRKPNNITSVCCASSMKTSNCLKGAYVSSPNSACCFEYTNNIP